MNWIKKKITILAVAKPKYKLPTYIVTFLSTPYKKGVVYHFTSNFGFLYLFRDNGMAAPILF